MNYRFVETKLDILKSVVEFSEKPEYWRAIIGNAAKYFVHIQIGRRHIFGLSKFCAFKNITVEEYISNFRYKTNGGTTQQYLVKLVAESWMPRKEINVEIRKAFDQWIKKFHPNYTLENASFITISNQVKAKVLKTKFIDPTTLEDNLKLQREIGNLGEQIAFEFELKRIRDNGIKNAEKYIEHTSTVNSGAGFDISSFVQKDNRFIEVKSSLNKNLDFFITENEYQTLKQLGNEAFLYLVHISNLTNQEGSVIHTITNPIGYLEKNGTLKPVAYKASLRRKKN